MLKIDSPLATAPMMKEQLLQLTIDNAAVGIAQIDRSGRFLMVNRKLQEITGYPEEELLQKTFQQITHPDDLDDDLRQAEALLNRKIDSYGLEKRYIRKDGSFVWIKLTGSAVFTPSGEFQVFIAIIEDISEKKETEAELKEKTEQLATTLNSITDGFFSLDRQWKITGMNKVAETLLFQCPAAELIGKCVIEVCPSFAGNVFHQEYQRALSENVSVHFEACSSVIDRWYEVHAYPRNDILDIYFRDITSRKQLEEALRKSEQKFSRLFYSSPCLMFITDIESGEYIEVNESFCRMTGFAREEVIGRDSVSLGIIEPEARARLLGQVKTSNRIELSETIFSDRMGVEHILLFSAEIISLNNDSYLLSSGIDITEHRKAEAELRLVEQRFRIAAAAARMGAYSRDYITGKNYWSPEFLSLYGLQPSDTMLLNDDVPLSIHPDDREVVISQTREHYKKNSNGDFASEHRIVLPDGKIRWVDVRGSTEFDNMGNPVSTCGIAMDITERKAVEEALRTSEEKYRALFNSLDEGFCICEMLVDENGVPYDYRWLEINPTWEEQTGLKSPVGKTARELVPDLEQQWFDVYGKVALTGESVRFQQKSDTMGRWFDVFAFRVGEPCLMQFGILFNDITNRKLAEEELRQKVEENEKLMDIMPAAIWISKDPSCDYIWGNRMANCFYEAEPDENFSANVTSARRYFRNSLELLPQELPMQRAVRENRQILNEVINVQLPSGRWFHMQGSAIPLNDEQGDVRGVMAAFVDVTERVEIENALRESEEKFRMLANNISQLAWIFDSKGNVLWYNDRWIKFTGKTLEELKGWDWRNVHHPEHVDRVVQKAVLHLESGEEWEDLFPLRDSNGEYRWFLSHATPLKNSDGEIIRWFGTNTDVTTQREYENQLENDNKLFENLLYIAAHDLKGPVANMYGALNLMDNLTDAQKLMFLGKFRDLADQLNNTIQGVTDILKIRNTSKSAASPENIELLFSDILQEFSGEINPSSVHGQFEQKWISYIKPYLYSILKNLISNSVKYSRDGVPLRIEIRTRKSGDYVLLSVRDNGIGIDLEKYKEKLYKPFERFGPKRTKGTGIGLFLIKDMVEKNGGYIELQSTPGEGTTFNCYLKEYAR